MFARASLLGGVFATTLLVAMPFGCQATSIGSFGSGGASTASAASVTVGSGGSVPIQACTTKGMAGTSCSQPCGVLCATGTPCERDEDCLSLSCKDMECADVSCDDGIENGDETDVDCGGVRCGPCPNLQPNGEHSSCRAPTDCESGACVSGECVTVSCTDTMLDGEETDVDCGGGTCPKCGYQKKCIVNSDCAGNLCDKGICAATCTDGSKNGDETDIDCGGSCKFQKCGPKEGCATDSDCAGKICDMTSKTCTPTCDDGVTTGGTWGETDVDCGGPNCPGCAIGGSCQFNSDCKSGYCYKVKCQMAPADDCTNNKKDGTETDVDCGGGSCPGCAYGKTCEVDSDCSGRHCLPRAHKCDHYSCSDGVADGHETDIDCGGNECPPCGSGQACLLPSDCVTGQCNGKTCI